MSATSQWAKNLPQLEASTLIKLASSWKTNLDSFALQKEGLESQLSLTHPNLEKWLSFYREHRQLTDECRAYCEKGGIDLSPFGNLYGRSAPHSEESLGKIVELISNADPSQLLEDKEGVEFPIAIAFLALVWLPCMNLYGEYPTVLLRKARHGDLETICDLIRLDRSVIFDSGISKFIHQWTLQFREVHLNKVGTALKLGLKDISIKKIKLKWAQYVYDSAINYGMPLTAPKVRALFDALAQDSGIGVQDPDLYKMTDDAFYQAIAKTERPLSNLIKKRQE